MKTSVSLSAPRAPSNHERTRTPDLTLGPFYPVGKVAPRRDDLTLVKDYGRRAQGQHVHLRGTVTDEAGFAVAGAEIQIWQANSAGRYRHPCDASTSPLDPDFDGFAEQITDANGGYGFRTVKPGAYLAPEAGMRAPHIHFQVTAGAFRLITQMFFDDESLNGQDRQLQALRVPALLVAQRVRPRGDSQDIPAYQWNLVVKRP